MSDFECGSGRDREAMISFVIFHLVNSFAVREVSTYCSEPSETCSVRMMGKQFTPEKGYTPQYHKEVVKLREHAELEHNRQQLLHDACEVHNISIVLHVTKWSTKGDVCDCIHRQMADPSSKIKSNGGTRYGRPIGGNVIYKIQNTGIHNAFEVTDVFAAVLGSVSWIE